MPDLSVTVASVIAGAGQQLTTGFAGEAILQGQSVYKTAAGLWMKAQADGTTIEAGSVAFGIALNPALTGQPVTVQTGGVLAAGATLTVGVLYAISETYGGIVAVGSLLTASKLTILGLAVTAGNLDMAYAKYTGLAAP